MTLLIRADADPQIGTGHVMRCLALAQAWREDAQGEVVFLTDAPPALRERLAAEGIESVPLEGPIGSEEDQGQTLALARRLDAAWVALDGYFFPEQYLNAVCGAGFRLLAIHDGEHEQQVPISRFPTCVVLDQNISAEPEYYAARGVDLERNALLSPRYALLRREFWAEPPAREVPEIPRRVLITLGGNNPADVLATVLRGLTLLLRALPATLGALEVQIAGGVRPPILRPEVQSAEAEIAEFERQGGVVLGPGRLDDAGMRQAMEAADLVVSAGGSTSWELARFGVPNLTLPMARNQEPIAAELAARGLSVNAGRYEDAKPQRLAALLASLVRGHAKRQAMSAAGRALVDGAGARRAGARMRAASGERTGG
jgi:UDP-2,4-diacetamido-2,4,6-trideoxy-beta-L-altropyranose hydrolase